MSDIKTFQATATTSASAVYTCPSGKTAMVKSIYVTNKTSNSETITVSRTDTSGSTTINIAYQQIVAPGYQLNLLKYGLTLEASDTLNITASTDSALDVVGSVLEF